MENKMENKVLQFKDLIRLAEDDILDLYRQGYRLDEYEYRNSYINSLAGCSPFNIVGAATTPAGTPTFTFDTPTGPASVPTGTNSVTFNVVVTNTGTASGATNCTLYEGGSNTIISTKGTNTIEPGKTETLIFTFSVVGWANGSFTICAKA
jgi:hypothetical protein